MVCNFEDGDECRRITTDRLIRSSEEEDDDQEFDPPVIIANGSLEDSNGNEVETMQVPPP